MSQKSDAGLDRLLDVLQYAIDRAKERGDFDVIVTAATAQAELVGLLDDPVADHDCPTIEALADAVELLVVDNLGRFSLADRLELITLLRDKVDHIEQKCS